MPIVDIFSKRQKRLRGDVPDVYTYDKIPTPLRVQAVQIMHEVLGSTEETDGVRKAYAAVTAVLRKELGVFVLPHHQRYGSEQTIQELSEFMLGADDAPQFLDAVELVCRMIIQVASQHSYRGNFRSKEVAADAIAEMNARFKEHGIGYEYDGEIIRIDTELVHVEAVKPALSLLRDPIYKGAEEEFLQAYAHYRKGNNKEALNEALKAFESTMKSICNKRRWTYAKTDPASKLIKVCFDNGLIPLFWETHFAALRATLEAGVPTGRNKLSGHGQGQMLVVVPDHLASYVLHMTASAIVFLVKSEKALPL